MDPQVDLRSNVSVYHVSGEGEVAIGVYLLLLGWLSWLGNGVVILLLTKQRHSLEPQDFLTLNLAVSDAGIAIFGYSRGILEVFNVFRDDGYLMKTFWTCKVDGFLILLFGLISINTLTAISVVRYIKGCQPHHGHHVTRRSVGVAIAAVWSWCLFWSGAPLVGWGSYRGRKYGTCEIDWAQARYSVAYRLYVITIFFFNFFIPISVIVFTYVSIMRAVNASHKSSRGGEVSERQRKIERSITQVSLLLCAAFLLAWSPYAVISMWSAFGYQVPPLNGILASLFAKSASFYNPLIYIGLSSKFRNDLRDLFRCLRRPPARNTPTPPLCPNAVQLNLEAFKEAGDLPGNMDSGVEMGQIDSIDASQSDREHLEGGPEGEEEAPEQTDCPRSPLVGKQTPASRIFMRRPSDSGRL
ncbi:opsin 6, group member b [Denticeps clupeoides]|uniref:G-protein coupled receptors family 1 profile domain-containing protein n=1 Tax=Denticeps clupeoides TaxID=299321 RepID=A0AAY4A5A4_9TELE|nr:opsin-5-like [Denticeps clupeoides]